MAFKYLQKRAKIAVLSPATGPTRGHMRSYEHKSRSWQPSLVSVWSQDVLDRAFSGHGRHFCEIITPRSVPDRSHEGRDGWISRRWRSTGTGQCARCSGDLRSVRLRSGTGRRGSRCIRGASGSRPKAPTVQRLMVNCGGTRLHCHSPSLLVTRWNLVWTASELSNRSAIDPLPPTAIRVLKLQRSGDARRGCCCDR